jgi:hypothetical protein
MGTPIVSACADEWPECETPTQHTLWSTYRKRCRKRSLESRHWLRTAAVDVFMKAAQEFLKAATAMTDLEPTESGPMDMCKLAATLLPTMNVVIRLATRGGDTNEQSAASGGGSGE